MADDAMEEDLELQMALALSIAEFQAGDQAAAEQGGGGSSSSVLPASEPRPATAATPATAAAAAAAAPATPAAPVADASSLGAALAAALSGISSTPPAPAAAPAPAPAPASAPTPVAAPAGAPAAQPQPQSLAMSAASLAAALQQALQGVAPAAPLGPAPGTAAPATAPAAASYNPAPPASFAAAPTAASAPGAPPGMTPLAAALQQAMQAMAQGSFPAGGAAPAPFPFAAAPSAAAGAAAGARTLAPSAREPPPAWLKPLLTWWDVPAASPGGSEGGAAPPSSAGAGAGESAALPGAEAQAALAVLGKALGEAVGLAGMPSQPPGALLLKCAAAGGSLTITRRDAETLLLLWLMRPKQATQPKLRALHDAYNALQAGLAAATEHGKGLIAVVSAAAAKLAYEQLRDDEGDLYEANGQATACLLRDLKQGAFSPRFLDAMSAPCAAAADAKVWARLLRAVLSEFSALRSIGGGVMDLEERLRMLDAFTSPPRLQACMVAALAEEAVAAQAAARGPGGAAAAAKSFEAGTVLGALLQISSLADPLSALRGPVSTANFVSRAKDALLSVRSYPANPGETDVVVRILNSVVRRVQEAGHLLLERLLRGKDRAGAREVVLAWMSLMCQLNEDRTLLGEARKLLNAVHLMTGCSDSLCLNLTAILLRFCRPFMSGYLEGGASGKFGDLMTRHLDPSYYTGQHGAARIGDVTRVTCLAGERGTAASAGTPAPPPKVLRPSLEPPPAGGAPAPSFIADCYFLTQRMVAVGVMPTISRYSIMMEYMQQASRNAAQDDEGDEGSGFRGGRRGAAPPVLPSLLWDCTRASLLEAGVAEDLVQYSLLTMDWLRSLLLSGRADTFKHIPEYALSAPLTWLEFVIRGGQAVLVASKPIGIIMASVIALLDNPAYVRSPILHDKAVKLLLVMLGPQLDVSRRTVGSSLGRTVMAPGEAALVSAVLRTAALQEGLLPALMRTYVAADFVVGLDVDTDAFDKFSMRSCIDMILGELWRDEPCRRSIVNLASTASSSYSYSDNGNGGGGSGGSGGSGGAAGGAAAGAAFRDYISCLLNSLMYLFKDSLDRLHDIHEIEASKAGSGPGGADAWTKLSSEEKKAKEAFYQGQQNTSKGFLRMAVATLQWLNTLAEHPGVLPAFVHSDTVGRSAYACVHFLELLVGPSCQKLQVERPEQYGFDRPALMESLVSLMLRLARAPGFITTLVAEPDFDEGILRQALALLEANHQAMIAQSLTKLIDAVAAASPSSAAASAAAAGGEQPMKLRRSADARDVADGMETSDGETAAAAGAGAGAAGGRGVSGGGAAEAGAGAGGQQLVCGGLPELAGAAPGSEDLAREYSVALEEQLLGDFNSQLPRAYSRQFAEMALEASGETPAKVKRLNKEVRDLHTRTRLPCHAAASIFLRHDSDRMDKMRCIITGPEGTPYEGGCFVFDLFFPAGYPNVAPLMSLQTTGEGRMRFNPNLYADGKVCLSLLGTWHGGHESEKWNPNTSTVFQIVMSIQSQIMVEDPYFNEPNVEAMRSTPEGAAHSATYNAELQLGTLRWAMIDILKHPPPGFEGVVRAHFRVLRRRILSTARKWVAAAAPAGEKMQRRMDDAVCELHGLLKDL